MTADDFKFYSLAPSKLYALIVHINMTNFARHCCIMFLTRLIVLLAISFISSFPKSQYFFYIFLLIGINVAI